jgi:hypothetical protein
MDLMQRVIDSDYEEDMSRAFRKLCSQDLQSISIKKLFLKLELRQRFNGVVLTQGLIGAIENNQEKYCPIIFDFMEKNKIKPNLSSLMDALFSSIKANRESIVTTLFDYMDKNGINLDDNLRGLQLIFNYTTSLNNTYGNALSKQLDEKYSIIEKSMSNEMSDYITLLSGAHFVGGTLNSDGSLETFGGMGGELSQEENERNHYSLNPILFNLNNFNAELLDSFFHNDHEVHPSVVKHGLVSNIYLDNSEAVLYLLSNKKCANIIKNSPELRAFINSDVNFDDRKKEARIALSMIELNEELGDNNTSKNKMKI